VTSARLHPTIRERVAADACPRRWRRCVYRRPECGRTLSSASWRSSGRRRRTRLGDGQTLALSAAVATIRTRHGAYANLGRPPLSRAIPGAKKDRITALLES
jgi:hypothetical protein